MGGLTIDDEDTLDRLSEDFKKHILADTLPTKENLLTWFNTVEDLIRVINGYSPRTTINRPLNLS